VVTFSLPSVNQTFVIGEAIPIKVNVQDPENRNKKINIYSNISGNLQQGSPGANGLYDYPWNPNTLTYQPPQTIGQHKLTAVLVDDDGFRVVSDELIINIFTQAVQTSSSQQSSSLSSQVSSISSNSSTQSSQRFSSAQSSSDISSAVSSLVLSSSSILIPSVSAISSSIISSILSSSSISSLSSQSNPVINSNFSGGAIRITQPSPRPIYDLKLNDNQNIKLEILNSDCPKLDYIKELKMEKQNYIEFNANCDKTEIKTYWSDLDPQKSFKFQKYNPITKEIIYNLSAQIFTENINGKKVVVSIHTITDNQNGDFDPAVGSILDPFTVLLKDISNEASKPDLAIPTKANLGFDKTQKQTQNDPISDGNLIRTGGSNLFVILSIFSMFIFISPIILLERNRSNSNNIVH
jgi:hypothetical protein